MHVPARTQSEVDDCRDNDNENEHDRYDHAGDPQRLDGEKRRARTQCIALWTYAGRPLYEGEHACLIRLKLEHATGLVERTGKLHVHAVLRFELHDFDVASIVAELTKRNLKLYIRSKGQIVGLNDIRTVEQLLFALEHRCHLMLEIRSRMVETYDDVLSVIRQDSRELITSESGEFHWNGVLHTGLGKDDQCIPRRIHISFFDDGSTHCLYFSRAVKVLAPRRL